MLQWYSVDFTVDLPDYHRTLEQKLSNVNSVCWKKKKGKNQKYPEDEVGSIDLVVLPNSKGFRFHYFKLSTKGQSIVLVN